MPDIRHVVFHRPGPRCQPDKGQFEQEGLAEHVACYRQLHAAGKLALGGPHPDGHAGGMMVPVEGAPEAEITAFAAADPGVLSGLLVAAARLVWRGRGARGLLALPSPSPSRWRTPSSLVLSPNGCGKVSLRMYKEGR